MNKLRFKALEKLFEAEINQLLPYQSKAQIYFNMEADELVERVTIYEGKLKIEGWTLTHKGRILYCQNCKDDGE